MFSFMHFFFLDNKAHPKGLGCERFCRFKGSACVPTILGWSRPQVNDAMAGLLTCRSSQTSRLPSAASVFPRSVAPVAELAACSRLTVAGTAPDFHRVPSSPHITAEPSVGISARQDKCCQAHAFRMQKPDRISSDIKDSVQTCLRCFCNLLCGLLGRLLFGCSFFGRFFGRFFGCLLGCLLCGFLSCRFLFRRLLLGRLFLFAGGD